MKLFFANLKIKKKFILAFVISALIPQTILGIILFLNLRTIALENAIKDTRKNVEDVKIKLTDIVQNAVDISNKLYLDKKLLNILSTEYKDISKCAMIILHIQSFPISCLFTAKIFMQ